MDNPRLARIEWGVLEGQRPRNAGSNARLGEHGQKVRVPLARLTTDDGSSGLGMCWLTPERAQMALGVALDDLFSSAHGVAEAWRWLDYPLWDLMGKRAGQPVYALAAVMNGCDLQGVYDTQSYSAPCYDTSLYFDDLHLASEAEAAALLATEAREGYASGHRAFKIKVGRGARHLPLEAGTQRDIAVVRAVHEAVGPDAPLMLDANNGYNLNLTKRVLEETADCSIFWIEEAFHEDAVLYRDLQAWLDARQLPTLIADGEGAAAPDLLRWAQEGLVDVIQYDIFGHGFTRWLSLGKQLDKWKVRSAPHHYGGHYGNYAACHLAGAIRGFTYVEFDAATTPGLDTSGYKVRNGRVHVPAQPGFGIEVDEDLYQKAVENSGFTLTL
ncbi:MAG: hypothetical protein JO316_24975 [Abitibacteriaceae bacterium]|nr:hypothetical protein [Abditibacteriaceae bacterium]